MTISDACTINVLLALALPFESVVNYARKWRHSLERRSRAIIYDRNILKIQVTYKLRTQL